MPDFAHKAASISLWESLCIRSAASMLTNEEERGEAAGRKRLGAFLWIVFSVSAYCGQQIIRCGLMIQPGNFIDHSCAIWARS